MNKNLIILGAGESGTGAAILGVTQGWNVFVSDKGQIGEKYKAEMLQFNIDWEEGSHDVERILNANLVIKSPGIPDKIELIQNIKAKGISVISEIEFAGWYTNATMIGISGTNGNSALHGTYTITAVPTTTTFTYTTTTSGTITSAADTGTAFVDYGYWAVTDFTSEGSTTAYNVPGSSSYNADSDVDFIIASSEDPTS